MPHPHFVLKMLPETHQGILVFWALAAWISCQQKLYFSSHHNAMSVDWLYYVQVQFSCSALFDYLWPHGLQHAGFLCPSPTPRVYSNSCPLNLWYHLILCCPLLPPSSIFPASGSFQRVSSSHHVAKILEFQLQHQSFQWVFRTDLL